LVQFKEVARVLLLQMNSECFSSDKTKWIFDQFVEFFKKTGFVIDDKAFPELLNTLKPRKRNIYLRFWDSIRKVGEDASEASMFIIRDELEKLYQARIIIYNAEQTADILEKVKIDGYKKSR